MTNFAFVSKVDFATISIKPNGNQSVGEKKRAKARPETKMGMLTVLQKIKIKRCLMGSYFRKENTRVLEDNSRLDAGFFGCRCRTTL
jgi:hypothetical protein